LTLTVLEPAPLRVARVLDAYTEEKSVYDATGA